jgi:hypothetical protein
MTYYGRVTTIVLPNSSDNLPIRQKLDIYLEVVDSMQTLTNCLDKF